MTEEKGGQTSPIRFRKKFQKIIINHFITKNY